MSSTTTPFFPFVSRSIGRVGLFAFFCRTTLFWLLILLFVRGSGSLPLRFSFHIQSRNLSCQSLVNSSPSRPLWVFVDCFRLASRSISWRFNRIFFYLVKCLYGFPRAASDVCLFSPRHLSSGCLVSLPHISFDIHSGRRSITLFFKSDVLLEVQLLLLADV